MDNENKEQVIFVKDLLFVALYQWRRILAVAILLAVVLGGFSFLSQNNVSDTVSQETSSAVDTNRQRINSNIATIQQQLDIQQKYCQSSILMRLDPYHMYQATIELAVSANDENRENLGAILHAYQVYLSSDAVVGSVAQQIDLDSKYLWEVLRFEGSEETRSLSITASFPTQDGAQQILDLFLAQFRQAQQQVRETAGAHESYIVVSSVNERIDLSVTEAQNLAGTKIETLTLALAAAQQELAALPGSSISGSLSVKKPILFAAIGAFLGAFLVVGIAWIAYISGGKVYSARTLRNATGLRVLGCLPDKVRKNAVDRWLRKLEGRCADPEHLAVVAATVRNCCPGEKLLLTGSSSSDKLETIAQALQELGLKPSVYGSLLTDAEALTALPGCDAVLLVESCAATRYIPVLEPQERIADQNKPLLGCVLLEG